MTHQFQKFREKPIEAVRYDGSLEAAVWLAGHSPEFDVLNHEHGHDLLLRGVEVRAGQFIRKWNDTHYMLCEPGFVHTHEPVSDIIKGD